MTLPNGDLLIGSGTFADVFSFECYAYKVVHYHGLNGALRYEYEHLQELYKTCAGVDPHSDRLCFSLPMPLAFFNPLTGELRASRRATEHDRQPTNAELVEHFSFLDERYHDRAIYSMELLTPIPRHVGHEIRARCYPEGNHNQPPPSICRVYLGRDRSIPPSCYFTEQNYPLDRGRYQILEDAGLFPRASSVAMAMGNMLGKIHWKGRNDARGIAFVMAGRMLSIGGISFWTIDFNETGAFADENPNPICANPTSSVELADHNVSVATPIGPSDISSHDAITADNDVARLWIKKALAKPFLYNDPYYPRPRPGEVLYEEFRKGYLAGAMEKTTNSLVHDKVLARAQLFLSVVESMQRDMDERNMVK